LGTGGESVEIKSASKSYGAVRALDNVTLKVAPREFDPGIRDATIDLSKTYTSVFLDKVTSR